MKIEYEPIGVIHTPFQQPTGMPRNPFAGRGVRGTVEVDPAYAAGLKDLDGFSHLVLLFHFHRSDGYELEVIPRRDGRRPGLFATRSPRRPNGIGLSVVRLDRVEGNALHVLDVDMVDGTPLLDIKPYLRDVRDGDAVRIGWLAAATDPAAGEPDDPSG